MTNLLYEELKSKWDNNFCEGLRCFDRICQDIEDDKQRKKPIKFVARKIRKASLHKRNLIYQELSKKSIMCRMYLSYEFQSFDDVFFPRFEVFYGKSYAGPTPMFVQPSHGYVRGFGENENFNLGIAGNSDVLNIPRIHKMSMSNEHSLFWTVDGKIYGCGKAAFLTVVGKETPSLEELFEEPRMLAISYPEIVEDILAIETASLIVTNKFLYVIGHCSDFDEEMADATFFEQNGRKMTRYAMEKSEECQTNFHFRKSERGLILVPYEPVEDYYSKNMYNHNNEEDLSYAKFFIETNCVEVELPLVDKKIKVSILQYSEHLMYSFVSDASICKECSMVLNGRLVKNENVVRHFTSPTGKVTVQLANGVLVTGRVEVLRLEMNDWWENCGDDPNMQRKYCRVVVVLEEIPGTFGVDTFCCSPDGESCIVQIGQTEIKYMNNYKDDIEYAKQLKFVEKFREAIVTKKPTKIGTIQKVEKRLSRIETRVYGMQPNTKIIGNTAMAIEMLLDLVFIAGSRSSRKMRFVQNGKNMKEMFIEQMEERIIRKVDCHRKSALKKIKDMNECLQNTFKTLDLSQEKYMVFFDYADTLLKMIEKQLKDDIILTTKEKDVKKRQTQISYEYEDMVRSTLKTHNIRKIVETRVKNEELSPDDIPIDFKIVMNVKHVGPVCLTRTNKVFFHLMYPDWMHLNDEMFYEIDNDYAYYNYFFHRADHLAIQPDEKGRDYYMRRMKKIFVRRSDYGEVLYRIEPVLQIFNFIRSNTAEEDVWYLECSNGVLVPVHRYLILLHSRLIQAKIRFDENRVGESEATNSDNRMIIKVDMTERVVRNSLTALLDMTTLYDKKIEDAIGVLIFYDFHMMYEAFDDALEIVFRMINDTNLDTLHWLFERFEKQMTPLLIKHHRIVLMSASRHIPPRSFIKDFCAIVTPESLNTASNSLMWPRPKQRYFFEPEDVLKLLVEFPEDLNEALLKSLAKDWGLSVGVILKKVEKKYEVSF